MRIFSFILLAFWVLADQALKLYTLNTFEYGQAPETIIPGFLALTYTLNIGAAWSLFSGYLGFLTVLRFTVALLITLYLFRKSVTGWPRIAFALIAGGAFGNAIDGLIRDGVVDMLVLWPLTTVYRAIFGTDFPIFNVADIGVVGGALLLVLLSFIAPKKEELAKPNPYQVGDETVYDSQATPPSGANLAEANPGEEPFDPTEGVEVYPDPRASSPDLPVPETLRNSAPRPRTVSPSASPQALNREITTETPVIKVPSEE